MALLVVIAVFILVPLAELYVILKVADSVLGALLLRSQGRSVWRRLNTALSDGRMPHREVVDGVLVVFGGAFLLTPGFITDVLGLLLLIPPTRALIRPLVVRRLGRRLAVGVVGGGGGRRRPAGADRDYDVEGTATEADAPTRGLDR